MCPAELAFIASAGWKRNPLKILHMEPNLVDTRICLPKLAPQEEMER